MSTALDWAADEADATCAPTELTVDVSTCIIHSVTVYRDRAEVKRVYSFTPQSVGEYEIKLQSLTTCADPESIRVKGIGSTGSTCQIISVSHDMQLVDTTAATADNGKKDEKESSSKALKEQLAAIDKDLKLARLQMDRLKRQLALTQKYVDTALCSRAPTATAGSSAPDAATASTAASAPLPLSTTQEILTFNMQQMEQHDAAVMELEERIALLTDQRKLKSDEWSKVSGKESSGGGKLVRKREVTVLVGISGGLAEDAAASSNDPASSAAAAAATAAASASTLSQQKHSHHVQLTYAVSNATWTPSYDIRVSTASADADNAEASTSKLATMTLHYFAEVRQSSGEDWEDCRLYLSTANPAVGSTPPPLPTKVARLGYQSQGYAGGRNGKSYRKSKSKVSFNKMRRESSVRYDSESGSDDSDDGRAASINLFEENGYMGRGAGDEGGTGGGGGPLTAKVHYQGDAGNTMFTVPRRSTIPSAGHSGSSMYYPHMHLPDPLSSSSSKPHKVTIAVCSFHPQLVHYAVPSASPDVYIQAKTCNTSPFPILPCKDAVAVFVDGSFVSKSSLGFGTGSSTAPGAGAGSTGSIISSGEFFTLFLGVDPSVKLVYLPCRTETRVRGWQLTGTTDIKKFMYSTVVTNTKPHSAIKLIVAEVMPKAEDERLTVELLEPAASSLTKPPSASAAAGTGAGAGGSAGEGGGPAGRAGDSAPAVSASFAATAMAASAEQDITAALDAFSAPTSTSASGGTPGAGDISATSPPPPPPLPKDFTMFNKYSSNVIWLKTVGAGERVELKFSYRVVWPHADDACLEIDDN